MGSVMGRRGFACFIATALQLGIATGADAFFIAKMKPLSVPTDAQWKAAFPTDFQTQHPDADATIACDLDYEGLIKSCRVIVESVPGMGQTMARLAPLFRYPPKKDSCYNTVLLHWSADESSSAEWVHSDWLHKPGQAAIAAYYPAIAFANHASGATMMQCVVTAEGDLTGCRAFLVSGRAGEGFEQVTNFRIPPLLKLSPATHNGKPAADTVQIPFNFRYSLHSCS